MSDTLRVIKLGQYHRLIPQREHDILARNSARIVSQVMRIIAKKVLREFWERYPDAEQPLKAWYQDAKQATWSHPQDIRQMYATASIIANNRVVFNIRGNNYRLITAINYDFGVVYIRFIGTHREYDRIDAANI